MIKNVGSYHRERFDTGKMLRRPSIQLLGSLMFKLLGPSKHVVL